MQRGQEISAKRISQSLQSTLDDLKRKVDEIKSSIDAEGVPAPKRPKERGFLVRDTLLVRVNWWRQTDP